MRRRAHLVVSAVVLWAGVGLTVERTVGIEGQLVLGAVTVAVLVALLALHTPAQRVQTLLVVAVASVAEVVGSLLWGLYTYRLDNLPVFVPPGHGLVFLGGVALARSFGTRASWLVAAATVGAGAWGVVSLTAFHAPDVAGAIGCTALLAVLVRTRTPVYAGVFFAVAALELAGTALGTWTWASTVPGLGLAQANPPSGVASGYVLFDVIALALAPRLIGLAARRRGRGLRQAAVAGPAPLRSRFSPSGWPGQVAGSRARHTEGVDAVVERRRHGLEAPIAVEVANRRFGGTPMPLPFVP
jgi:hypothetical protein